MKCCFYATYGLWVSCMLNEKQIPIHILCAAAKIDIQTVFTLCTRIQNKLHDKHTFSAEIMMSNTNCQYW